MPRPARLSRDQLVATALRLLREEGPDALTLRRLADEVGASPMALYRHVRDQRDLAQAVVDAASPVADVRRAIRPTATWTDQLRAAATAFYQSAHRDRPVVELGLRARVVAAWEPELAELFAGIAVRGGHEPMAAVALARFVATAVGALVTAEVLGRIPSDEDWPAARREAQALGRSLDPEMFPVLHAGAAGLLPRSRRALAGEFADFVVAAATAHRTQAGG